jgi:hypothetical protein
MYVYTNKCCIYIDGFSTLHTHIVIPSSASGKQTKNQSFDRELERQRCKFLQRQRCKFLQRQRCKFLQRQRCKFLQRHG